MGRERENRFMVQHLRERVIWAPAYQTPGNSKLLRVPDFLHLQDIPLDDRGFGTVG